MIPVKKNNLQAKENLPYLYAFIICGIIAGIIWMLEIFLFREVGKVTIRSSLILFFMGVGLASLGFIAPRIFDGIVGVILGLVILIPTIYASFYIITNIVSNGIKLTDIGMVIFIGLFMFGIGLLKSGIKPSENQ